MRIITTTLVAAALLGAALCLPGCADQNKREPGGVAIVTTQATATVTAVNSIDRTVTLRNQSGETKTYKLSKDVVNFNQIKVGDKVRATLTDELAVFVHRTSDPVNAVETQTVSLAPKGAKPGIVATNTIQATCTITKIDAWSRKVTLKDPTGKVWTVRVADDVDLSTVKVGDNVVVRYTEAMALVVESN